MWRGTPLPDRLLPHFQTATSLARLDARGARALSGVHRLARAVSGRARGCEHIHPLTRGCAEARPLRPPTATATALATALYSLPWLLSRWHALRALNTALYHSLGHVPCAHHSALYALNTAPRHSLGRVPCAHHSAHGFGIDGGGHGEGGATADQCELDATAAFLVQRRSRRTGRLSAT